jgi:hypothetical protein
MTIDELKESLRLIAELKDSASAVDLMVRVLLDCVNVPDDTRLRRDDETLGEFAVWITDMMIDDPEVKELVELINSWSLIPPSVDGYENYKYKVGVKETKFRQQYKNINGELLTKVSCPENPTITFYHHDSRCIWNVNVNDCQCVFSVNPPEVDAEINSSAEIEAAENGS